MVARVDVIVVVVFVGDDVGYYGNDKNKQDLVAAAAERFGGVFPRPRL